MNIGQRIKQRRLELEMSLEQLANKLGVNRSTVYRYETGEIEKMPIGVVKPIAEALSTTPAYIMGWDEEEIKTESEMISEANAEEDAEEERLKNLQEEFGEVHFTPDEVKKIKLTYYDLVNIPRNQQEIIEEMWSLQLSVEELKELCDYAKYLKSKRK